MLIRILKTKKKWLSVVKGLSDAALRLIPTLRMMPAWNGTEYMMMWHEVEITISL